MQPAMRVRRNTCAQGVNRLRTHPAKENSLCMHAHSRVDDDPAPPSLCMHAHSRVDDDPAPPSLCMHAHSRMDDACGRKLQAHRGRRLEAAFVLRPALAVVAHVHTSAGRGHHERFERAGRKVLEARHHWGPLQVGHAGHVLRGQVCWLQRRLQRPLNLVGPAASNKHGLVPRLHAGRNRVVGAGPGVGGVVVGCMQSHARCRTRICMHACACMGA
eukprot:31764-Chlamydomonas_euryale.AAC.2